MSKRYVWDVIAKTGLLPPYDDGTMTPVELLMQSLYYLEPVVRDRVARDLFHRFARDFEYELLDHFYAAFLSVYGYGIPVAYREATPAEAVDMIRREVADMGGPNISTETILDRILRGDYR